MHNISNEEWLSKTISFLRFPLTVGVVYIHFNLSEGLSLHGEQYGLDNPEWYFFIINLVSNAFARIGVPLFFVISGFLFFYRSDFNSQTYQQKLKKRALTLLVPYILWNFIDVVWQMKCLLPGISSFYSPVEIHISFERIINTFFCCTSNNGIIVGPPSGDTASGAYPIDIPLWYVRELMIMVVLTPVIYFFTKNKIRKVYIGVLGLIWFLSPYIIPVESYLWQFVTAAFFFSFGSYFSVSKGNMVISFQKIKYGAYLYLPLAVLDALTRRTAFNDIIHQSGIIFGIIMAVVVASFMVKRMDSKTLNWGGVFVACK